MNPKKEKFVILNFQEFLIWLGSFTLMLNFITAADTVENNLVKNRPHVLISTFTRYVSGVNYVNLANITNVGSTPAYNVRIHKSLKYKGGESQGEETDHYATLYMNAQTNTIFYTPTKPVENFLFYCEIEYDDYRNRHYTCKTEYEYEPESNRFIILKADEVGLPSFSLF